jgi:hypothetical protein
MQEYKHRIASVIIDRLTALMDEISSGRRAEKCVVNRKVTMGNGIRLCSCKKWWQLKRRRGNEACEADNRLIDNWLGVVRVHAICMIRLALLPKVRRK